MSEELDLDEKLLQLIEKESENNEEPITEKEMTLICDMPDIEMNDADRAVLYNRGRKTNPYERISSKSKNFTKQLTNDISISKIGPHVMIEIGGERFNLATAGQMKMIQDRLKKFGVSDNVKTTQQKNINTQLRKLSRDLTEAKRDAARMPWDGY